MDSNPLLPFSFAKEHNLLALADEVGIRLVSDQWPSASLLTEIQRVLGPVEVKLESSSWMEKSIQQAYESSSSVSLEQFDETDQSLDSIAMDLKEPSDLLDNDDQAPVIRLLNALIAQAILDGASDIHLESYEHRVRVRFRIDGKLKSVMEPSLRIAPLLVSRIKVMAKLDISEKRVPQDGRIAIRLGGRAVDLRVSTLPAGIGEKVVLRVLDKQAGRLDLSQIGMPPRIVSDIHKLIQQPHGIVLVTGPTGSGKTTTLYGALSELNDNQRNISTVEDPIEYFIDGINQTPIHTKIDMTFAKGLKAILRQDPDVIMVGEIRDTETAQIAVQASLTGHLVLSTLHTNTSIGAIARLRDMGVEPFLLASSLSGVLSQRLIRVLCSHCRSSYEADPVEQKLLGLSEPAKIYSATGCDSCSYTGYKGRTGLFELLVVDDSLKRQIHSEASETDLKNAVRDTLVTTQQQAIDAVLAGTTSVDEAVRTVSL